MSVAAGTFVHVFPVLDPEQHLDELLPEAQERFAEVATRDGVVLDGPITVDTVEAATPEHTGVFLRLTAPAHRAHPTGGTMLTSHGLTDGLTHVPDTSHRDDAPTTTTAPAPPRQPSPVADAHPVIAARIARQLADDVVAIAGRDGHTTGRAFADWLRTTASPFDPIAAAIHREIADAALALAGPAGTATARDLAAWLRANAAERDLDASKGGAA